MTFLTMRIQRPEWLIYFLINFDRFLIVHVIPRFNIVTRYSRGTQCDQEGRNDRHCSRGRFHLLFVKRM